MEDRKFIKGEQLDALPQSTASENQHDDTRFARWEPAAQFEEKIASVNSNLYLKPSRVKGKTIQNRSNVKILGMKENCANAVTPFLHPRSASVGAEV